MAAILTIRIHASVFAIWLYLADIFVGFGRCDLQLTGISPVDSSGSIKDGVIEITADTPVLLRLYGAGFSRETRISFTYTSGKSQEICNDDRTKPLEFQKEGLREYKGEVEVNLISAKDGLPYFVCLQAGNTSEWLHQGANDKLLQITTITKTSMFPLWLRIVFITILMALSGIFSGLNLGLMALDPFELKIVMNSGKPNEKEYAKTIEPVRRHGNYLLCTLLLGNVLVNTSFTVLLDGIIGNGIAAVLGSTAGIVIFGEILPQSICSRHGLAVGSRTIWLTKFFMLITFPISFPISKILDCVLGNEIGTVYNRQQLLEMLKVTAAYSDLEGDEMDIISGVLNYKRKTVEEVMTKLDDCFILDQSSVLDFRTIATIMESGHSRIPVYDQERHNIVGLLFVKDLAFIDSDDCTPLRTVIKFYKHNVQRVFFDVHLDKMLEEFKSGQSHLAVVQRVNNEGDGDPYYEAIGIVTLEDILEEIIQSEIVDETDVFLDNKSGKVIPGRKAMMKNLAVFSTEQEKPKISPQLQLAVLQYLATALDAFSEDIISLNVLKRLINQPHVIQETKLQDTDAVEHKYLYKKGAPTDFFILIINGKVEVLIGQEGFSFEEGPFTFFGAKALLQSLGASNLNNQRLQQYVPDYSVRIVSDITYLKISKGIYRQAVQATLMERQQGSGAPNDLMNANLDQENLTALVDGSVCKNRRLPPSNVYMETTC